MSVGVFNSRTGQMYDMRSPDKNPHSPTCSLHLRRVCGVCPHFDGPLRGKGRCRLLDFEGRGGRSAHDCEHWSRKVAGANG